MTDGIEKETTIEEIIKVTDKTRNVKRELFYCNDIVERTNEVVENIKYIEEEKWKKQNEKNKMKSKAEYNYFMLLKLILENIVY